MWLLKNEKFFYFAGGITAAIAGSHAVKSGVARKFCVKGLAAGIKLQKRALESFQNVKEEAADMCLDATSKVVNETNKG